MKTFDYARAWHDLAVPQYNKLSEEMRRLWADFQEEAKEGKMYQERGSLDTAGVSGELRARFRAFSDIELAKASRAIYSCGHWDPGIHGGNFSGKFDKYGTGAAWKFANVCDVELRRRLLTPLLIAEFPERCNMIPQEYKGVAIIEGMLREQFSTPCEWRWFETGWATAEGMQHRSHRPAPLPQEGTGRNRRYTNAACERLENYGERCKAGAFTDADGAAWLDTTRFMVPDKGYQGFAKRDKFKTHKEELEARRWAARGMVTV